MPLGRTQTAENWPPPPSPYAGWVECPECGLRLGKNLVTGRQEHEGQRCGDLWPSTAPAAACNGVLALMDV